MLALQSRLFRDSEIAADSPSERSFIQVVDQCPVDNIDSLLEEREVLNTISQSFENSGAVLLRDMPIRETNDAEALLSKLGVAFDDDYLGGASPRSALSDHFFTSTEAPAPYVITFHTEMCYLKQRPGKIFFYCITEPNSFGETPVFDCAAIFDKLPDELQHKVEHLGVMYRRYFVDKKARFFNVYKTWMDAFKANSREQAEVACVQQGLDFEWQNDGCLVTQARMPGYMVDSNTGRKCISMTIYNSESAPYDMFKFRHRINPISRLALSALVRSQYAKKNVFMKTLWGDGSEITPTETRTIIDTAWKCSNIFKWRSGDLLILDNIRVGHGRLNVVKPRKIAAALGDPYTV